jgi:lipoate-protein ligase A
MRSAEFIPHPGPRTSVRGLALFDGPFNMAEDARLLASAEKGSPGWRVYGWDGPWVSLGRYQTPSRDLFKPDETNWVMRPTGGKAVLHGHDVTVGLALPLSLLARVSGEPEERLERSLRTVYRLTIRPIVKALRACGLPAVLGEERATKRRIDKTTNDSSRIADHATRISDCFAVTSPNDVVHERLGVKVCGCALKLTSRAVLVQASLPAGPPLVDPFTVFEKPAVVPSVHWEAERFEGVFGGTVERLS